QREGQHLLAAELVADVVHEEGADRARDIADAEGCEGGDGGQLGIDGGKEDLAEHQRRGGAVDEEVVVLDRAADPARKSGFLRGAYRLPGGGGCSAHEGCLLKAKGLTDIKNVLTSSLIEIGKNPW